MHRCWLGCNLYDCRMSMGDLMSMKILGIETMQDLQVRRVHWFY